MTDEPQTVYVVIGSSPDAEPAVFAQQRDADAFAEAVSALGPAGVYTLLVCEGDLAQKMIAEARSRKESPIPEGVAWPMNVGSAPEGWSWVERDDEEDIYPSDEDAAEALIRAGIGTEYRYFHRQTLEDRTKGAGAEWAHLIGCSVAINVPEPEEGETVAECVSCERVLPGAPGAGGASHLCNECGGKSTREESVR